MKSKMSFFNKGLISSNLKRYSWVSVIWSVLLFLALPLSMMTFEIPTNTDALTSQVANDAYSTMMHRFGGDFANLMLVSFPVLIGMLVFRYLHSQKSSTVMHGLPFTRLRLFANSLISALILILIPLILNTVIIFIIKASMPIGNFLDTSVIFTWLLNSVCICFCIFSLSVFVGMFTGNLIAHIVFTYIVHFLPLMLYVSINEILAMLVHGYHESMVPDWLTSFPMMRIFSNCIDLNLYYIIFGIILFVLAFIVYRKRPNESGGDIVSFRFMRPVFKYGVTFCAAIFGYLFFSGITGRNQMSIIALVFVVIGYALAQMLISKSWRFYHAWKGLLASVIIWSLIWCAIEYDVTGFEKRVPITDTIESITVESGLPAMDNTDIIISNKDDILNLRNMHEALTENETNEYDAFLKFTYKLSNGKTMSRAYKYALGDYETYLKPLFYSESVREQGMGILKVHAEDIVDMSIHTYKPEQYGYKTKRISDKEQIESFLDAYKYDLRNISYEDLVYAKYDERIYSVGLEPYPAKLSADGEMIINYRSCELTKDFTQSLAWLKENVFNENNQ